MRVSLSIVVTLPVILCLSANCKADAIVSYEESSLGGGLWLYNYTVVNQFNPATNPGVDLYEVTFQFPQLGFLLSLPGGWDQTPIGTFFDTFSTNPGEPPSGTDIPPMQRLDGFLFVFDSQIGPVPFAATFANPANPNSPLLTTGTTSSAVPEPGSVMMLGLGIGVAYLLCILPRKEHRRLKR